MDIAIETITLCLIAVGDVCEKRFGDGDERVPKLLSIITDALTYINDNKEHFIASEFTTYHPLAMNLVNDFIKDMENEL